MTQATASQLPRDVTPNREWRATNFAFSILLSAFLLFQVQPLVSKFILPWFGGTPAVWTTCMLFFQALLFFGYAYAHWVSVHLPPRAGALLHGALLLAACLLAPIVPGADAKPADDTWPTLRIFWLLLSSVGLPYFVLSSTGPLLQSWYARAFPGRSPYRLYALSNFGSLVALLSYPVVFEPALDAETQARLWRGGFVVFAVLCAIAANSNAQLGGTRRKRTVAELATLTNAPNVGAFRRFAWIALPAAASLVLLATTNHVCQDVAVIPFLWVVPLALYLLTFIIAFDHPRWYSRRGFAIAGCVLSGLIGCMGTIETALEGTGIVFGFVAVVALHFALLFVVCLLCHGELVRLRPEASHLTEFYLLMSLGGALGGACVSLVAPAVFHSFLEWPAGLVLSCLGSATLLASLLGLHRKPWALVAFCVPSLALAWGIVREQVEFDPDELEVLRNFYGVVGVYEVDRRDPALAHRSLTHGIIVHGRQFTAPEKQLQPVAYYAPTSGVGRAITHFANEPSMRLGVVGLGVGTVATYLKPGQSVRFYEINPQVKDLAERYFTYLDQCRGQVEFAMGDARISLEREATQDFHVLVLDAFSGDSVPVHLLTREAFVGYARHLRPDGILAVNITNHNLDLSGIVAGAGEQFGFSALRIEGAPEPAQMVYHNVWMLLSRDPAVLAAIPHAASATEIPGKRGVWTDRYSDLLSVLQ